MSIYFFGLQAESLHSLHSVCRSWNDRSRSSPWKVTSVGAHAGEKIRSASTQSPKIKAVREKFVQQSSDFPPLLEFWRAGVCGSTFSLLPPRQAAPLSLPLCALAPEVTSFGVRQAGTQQEQLSLSELLNFSGEEEREGED